MDLRTWVEDNIIKLAGGSNPTVVDFVLASAKSSKSSSHLHGKLSGFLEGPLSEITSFSDELYRRQSHAQSNGGRAKENGTKEKQREQKQVTKKYALVDMEDELEPAVTPKPSGRPKERSKRHRDRGHAERDKPRKRDRSLDGHQRRDEERRHKSRKHVRRRENDDDRWGDQSGSEQEDEMFAEPEPKRVRLDLNGSGKNGGADGDVAEVEGEDEEDEEARDQREKVQFEKRLREKDEASTKKHGTDRSSARKDREVIADTGGLRMKSRQEYLVKREAERLALFRKQVAEEADEERNNPDLTKAELDEFARNRETLRLAEARLNVDDYTEGYALPEDYITEKGQLDRGRKEKALNDRMVERDEYGHEKFVSEMDQWEAEQESKARAQIRRSERVDEGDYEYVFDEARQIKFISGAGIQGQKMTAEERMMQQKLNAAEQKAASIEETRKSLPVYAYKKGFLQALEENQIIILEGETGSGKSTQIPQYLHEAGYTKGGLKIGCTQPRRVAAMSVAARVAEEMGVKLGNEVGYAIRFEDNTNEKTIIKYMTDGMLLREFLTEPDLGAYSCLIIDEAHERTISTDVLFGLLKDLARARPELKLIISSATLNAQKFSDYLDDAPIYKVPGRRYKVDILYTKAPEANYLAAAVTTIFQIHLSQPRGDILVFLTGQDEIESMATSITETTRKLGNRVNELIVCEIYANLPTDLQQKIFEPTPPKARKVVLATNIAETSITVDGVQFVIDPGFVKQNVYNARTGMESLVVEPVSRAAAGQRAGRAGRTGPGKCFRLYTRYSHENEMPEETLPEIQRANLNSVVLLLKSMGIHDLVNFDFLDPPSTDHLVKALEELYALGGLNDKGSLTKDGRRMVEFPTSPLLSKSVLAASKYGCVDEILSIIALLGETASLFFRPRDKKVQADAARARFACRDGGGGDHLTLLNVWNAYVDADFSVLWCRENFLQERSLKRARDVKDQLVKLCDRVEVEVSSLAEGGANADEPVLLKALTSGFFPNAARLNRGGDSYRTVKTGLSVALHPSSVLLEDRPRWIIFYELVFTSREFCRSCFALKPEWLLEVAPHYYKRDEVEKMGGAGGKVPKGQGAVAAKF